MIRIIKVKMTKDNRIYIQYNKMNDSGQWDEFTMTCFDHPSDAFYEALSNLKSHVIDMCELTNENPDKIIVKGVAFSYAGEKETMGATIIAQKMLEKSNINLNLNTPHKASEFYSEYGGDEKQLLTEYCVSDLTNLQEQCIKYINGERAQMSLFAANA